MLRVPCDNPGADTALGPSSNSDTGHFLLPPPHLHESGTGTAPWGEGAILFSGVAIGQLLGESTPPCSCKQP